jgi:hypothetical protein
MQRVTGADRSAPAFRTYAPRVIGHAQADDVPVGRLARPVLLYSGT